MDNFSMTLSSEEKYNILNKIRDSDLILDKNMTYQI